MPRIRACPEDFLVEELPLYPPSGEGHHALLLIEKRLRDTDEVARELAACAGVEPGQVGYAGRKDRAAVARQWLTVPGLDPERALALPLTAARVLAAHRHRHRLRLGDLAGNRFRLVVREVTPAQGSTAAARLVELGRRGMPNRFGSQRYGRDGGNVARGQALLRGERLAVGRRRERLYLSALQSAVFDEVLRRRPLPVDGLVAGDLALVHSTGALLAVGDPDELAARAARFELSATGPLVGHKMRRPRGQALAIERAAAAACGVPWVDALPRLRGHLLPGERRPVRAPIRDARATMEGDGLRLDVTLPPGSYVTVLVEELFPDGVEEGPAPS
ncbi:MAG TPA: tRNA pseudouridine(13) synthase TruD [Thermoanaerobaculia bacterium]|nr:tRNA pseudouridine(13) synthase TruD [Thermoanaerobaculia bacterium]